MRKHRQEITNTVTGAMLTRARTVRVDPMQTLRGNPRAPRRPAWWDDDDETPMPNRGA